MQAEVGHHAGCSEESCKQERCIMQAEVGRQLHHAGTGRAGVGRRAGISGTSKRSDDAGSKLI